MAPQTTSRATTTTTATTMQSLASGLVILSLFVATGSCWRQQVDASAASSQRVSLLAARRAADDSRPLLRVAAAPLQRPLSQAESQESSSVVVGKFRAPAPERFHRQRVPKSSDYASHTMSASYQVSDADATLPEKVVHGIVGGSAAPANNKQQQQSIKRTVSAKIQVSDEGLNYPASKLSADIYGNVAEIVTAPPDSVDNDFLVPQSSRFGRRP